MATKEYMEEKKQEKNQEKKDHLGAKIAKVLFPLIFAAFCLAGVIQGTLLHAPVASIIGMGLSCVLLASASWFFLGSELGMYYDKEAKKLKLHSGYSQRILKKRNQFAWILCAVAVLIFALSLWLGGQVVLLIVSSWLLG